MVTCLSDILFPATALIFVYSLLLTMKSGIFGVNFWLRHEILSSIIM